MDRAASKRASERAMDSSSKRFRLKGLGSVGDGKKAEEEGDKKRDGLKQQFLSNPASKEKETKEEHTKRRFAFFQNASRRNKNIKI